MELDPQSVKSQLTDLFNKTDNLKERVTAIEILTDQNNQMIKGINDSNQKIEEWTHDAHRVLYGDDKTGMEGLVKQHNKMWLMAQRIAIGAAIAFYFAKELNLINIGA